MNFKILVIFLFSAILIMFSGYLSADTVKLKDGKECKGIIVEDYNDRVLLSTVDGEKTINKSDIEELYFDNEEDNLIKLAEQARDRRDFAKAFTYYNMALKANPVSKAANNGLVFLQGYLFRKEEMEKLDDIKRRENIERYGSVLPSEKTMTEEERFRDLQKRLYDVVGLRLVIEKNFPRVARVRPKSPAYGSGMRQGDTIVALWEKLAGYMTLAEVMEALLDKPSLEIKCVIERTAETDPSGLTMGMELKGLTMLADTPDGIMKKDDIVTYINDSPTRYMPFKKALYLIKRSKGSAKLTFRRDVLIWRG